MKSVVLLQGKKLTADKPDVWLYDAVLLLSVLFQIKGQDKKPRHFSLSHELLISEPAGTFTA